MAKGHARNSHTNAGTFLGEEQELRGRLPGGRLKVPQPRFVQPDNGAGPGTGDSGRRLNAGTDPTKVKHKSSNVETDITGGLY